MDNSLEIFKVFADIAKALFKQWDKIEVVAEDFIEVFQTISLKLIDKM